MAIDYWLKTMQSQFQGYYYLEKKTLTILMLDKAQL